MDVADAGKTVDYWLDRLLSEWAEWMQRPGIRLGLPKRAAVGENYTSLDLDNEIAYDALDDDLAIRTNAVIDGLPPAQRMAIYRCYGIVSVWRFPRDNYADVLIIARANVLTGLKKRGVWVGE